MNNVQAGSLVTRGVGVVGLADFTVDKDSSTRDGISQPWPLHSLYSSGKICNIPLGQAQQEVARRALGEGGDSEPAGLSVGGGTAVAGDGVADHLATVVGAANLGRVGQVADNGDAGEGSWGRGAEGAGAGRGKGGAAEDVERHFV